MAEGVPPRFEMASDGAPPAAALVLWREATGLLFDVEPMEAPFRASFETYSAGGILFGTARSSAQRFIRDATVVQRSGVDHLLVQVYTAGRFSGSAGRHAISVEPGDVVILDLARTFITEASAFENTNLLVPRHLVPVQSSDPSLHGMVFRAASPTAGLFAAHMKELVRIFAQATDAECEQSVDLTLALLRALILSEGVEIEVQSDVAEEKSTFGKVCHYIGHHLEESDLTVSRLCAHFGISRASIYRMFDPLGGIATYIRSRRLERAFELLTTAGAKGERIAAIAARCGFSNEDTFARAFKARYGVGPMRLRQEGRRALFDRRSASAETTENTLSRWIRNLGPSGSRAERAGSADGDS